jgi:hypothetical protein
MRLTKADFDGAVDLETFRNDWQKFLAQSSQPLVTAWNQSTLDLLGSCMSESVARVTLKSAYRNVYGGGCGCLEDVILEASLAVGPPRFKGRAGSRIASALAIARHLNARALQHHAE